MSETERWVEAQLWLRYSREDLLAAEAMAAQPAVAPRHICWLAQQAAEKALKAVLILLQIDFPKRHDLDVLRNLVPAGWGLKAALPDLAELTEWAVEARYPGSWGEATVADAQVAVREARQVWDAVRRDLAERGFSAEELA